MIAWLTVIITVTAILITILSTVVSLESLCISILTVITLIVGGVVLHWINDPSTYDDKNMFP